MASRPLSDFNPRTREGCDGVSVEYERPEESISIHAPVKGATVRRKERVLVRRISIHAPVKGATVSRVSTMEVC